MARTIIHAGKRYKDYKFENEEFGFVDIYDRSISNQMIKILRNLPLCVKYSLGEWKKDFRKHKEITETVLN